MLRNALGSYDGFEFRDPDTIRSWPAASARRRYSEKSTGSRLNTLSTPSEISALWSSLIQPKSLRVRLESNPEGQLVYLLEVPEQSSGVLRSALGSYDGIELRDPATLLDRPVEQGTTLRTELVLARPSIEPLAHLGFDPDPLQPFAAAMAGTDPRDEVSVCVDLLPAKGRRRARLRRRLRREAKRLGIETKPFRERLGMPTEKRREVDPVTAAERRIRGRGLDAKLRDGGQPFEAQILLRVRASSRPRAKANMQNLLASFESVADRNWLKAKGLTVPGLAFLGSDLPLVRRRFDRRFSTGLFRPSRQNVLTGRELAGFLKPPTIFCSLDNVARSGAKLSPAPSSLPSYEPTSGELIPLGRVTDEIGDRLVAVRAAGGYHQGRAGVPRRRGRPQPAGAEAGQPFGHRTAGPGRDRRGRHPQGSQEALLRQGRDRL